MDGTTTVLSDVIHRKASRTHAASGSHSPISFPWLALTEVVFDALAVLICIEIGFHLSILKAIGISPGAIDHSRAVALIFSCIMVILLDRAGAYRSSGGLLRIRETTIVLESVFLAAVLIIPCMFLTQSPRWVLFILLEAPFVAVVLVLQKYAFHNFLSQIRRNGVARQRVLIYGTEASARMLCAALTRSPKLGFLPVALVNEPNSNGLNAVRRMNDEHCGVVSIPHVNFSASLIRDYRADMVFISSPFASQIALRQVIRESAEAGTQVVYSAEASPLGPTEIDYIELDGQLVYGEHQLRTSWLYDLLSRCLDVLVSSVMLLCALAPLLLTALAIRFESQGPIFFRQVRIGRDGTPFTILKFRTMYENSCKDSVSPVDSNDPRITRVGKWLRRTSFDELPQLINVLRGDMALVGPRPEMPFIVADYSDRQRQRLLVKPGLTGIWQISADRRYPIHENIHYDLYYLKHRSLAMNVALLFHTLFFALHGT